MTSSADFGARAAEMLASDPYAAHLGVALVAAEEGRVVVTMNLQPFHANFLGGIHGGAVFSLADVALSLISNAPGPRAVAIDTHLVLTGSAETGDTLVAVAEETSRGRTLATYRITVRRGDERVVGVFTGTVFIQS